MTTPVTRAAQPQSTQATPLSGARDAQFTFQQLWPAIDRYARQYGADPHVLAAIVMQESSFKSWGVHRDGTGHGLIGLAAQGAGRRARRARCGTSFAPSSG